MDFYVIGINLLLVGKNVSVVMVPTLINKDVFVPSYDDLKFMIQNCNYIYTNLIHAIEYTVLGKFPLTL